MYPLTARVPPTVAVEDGVRVVKFVDPVTPKLPPTARFPVSVSPAVVKLVVEIDENVPVPVQATDAKVPVPLQATADVPTGPNAPVPVQTQKSPFRCRQRLMHPRDQTLLFRCRPPTRKSPFRCMQRLMRPRVQTLPFHYLMLYLCR